MLEFTVDGSFLLGLVTVLKGCLPSFSLRCDSNGMTMQSFEPSNVAVLSLTLPTQAMFFYRCDTPQRLGIVCEPLVAAICDASEGDKATLKKLDDSNEQQTLTVDLVGKQGGAAGGNSHRSCEVPVSDVSSDAESMDLPVDQTYDAVATVRASKLQSALIYLSKFNQQLTLAINKKEVYLSISTDQDQIEVFLQPVKLSCTKEVSSCFHSRLLLKIGKLCLLSEEVVLSMSADTPLRVAYSLRPKNSTGDGRLLFYLAPYGETEADGGEEEEEEVEQEEEAVGGEVGGGEEQA
eukprot:GHVS01006019.1.p1 GENE.GHVS01006019.1~~GHVS01006019.1.p1  ORF type:complete len:293 (-),score=75.90 GHVS01006019.1:352-1230(-)